jgi:hypothetical protein
VNRVHYVGSVREMADVPKGFGKGDTVVIYFRGRGVRNALALALMVFLGSTRARALGSRTRATFWIWLQLHLLGYRVMLWASNRNLLRV